MILVAKFQFFLVVSSPYMLVITCLYNLHTRRRSMGGGAKPPAYGNGAASLGAQFTGPANHHAAPVSCNAALRMHHCLYNVAPLGQVAP